MSLLSSCETPGFSKSDKPNCRLGVLLSGRGSNFSAILRAIETATLKQADIAVVISNNPQAAGLRAARENHLPTAILPPEEYPTRALRDEAIVQILLTHQVDILILAGYDRIIGPHILEAFAGRVLNIHPSLLPAYGGKNMVGIKVHEAVLENRESESGCTVHLVTEIVDGGAILGQARVPVLPDDTPDTLAARVLAQEHRLYPTVIQSFIETQWVQKGSLTTHA